MKAEIDLKKRLAFGEDLTGQKFGKRTVIEFAGIKRPPCGRPARLWKVECICGKIDVIQATRLKSGNADSCGCTKAADAAKQWLRHGHAAKGHVTKLFKVWATMLQRCNNPKNTGYFWYGYRGIKVCERWESYQNFLTDMGPSYKTGLSIDRINNDGNYEPGNCRWATAKQQRMNCRPKGSCGPNPFHS